MRGHTLSIAPPRWDVDPNFDLDFHVHDSAVPPPGTPQQVAETVARIFARPLDRRRPLWELWTRVGLPTAGKVIVVPNP